MDNQVLALVRKYIMENAKGAVPPFDAYTVWKAKVLKNWKYLVATSLDDGMYYEMTFNGEDGVWYLDAYKKVENRVITIKRG